VIVLTCWYRGAPNNVVQLDGSGGGPPSVPGRPVYYVSIKFMVWNAGDVPGLNISGNTRRTSLRISRSLLSSGVLRARTPYSVTRR
jgi:hypothetical protein